MSEELTGRVLDAAVARVLGWTEIVWDDRHQQNVAVMPGRRVLDFVPAYSTDPAAALAALEELYEREHWLYSLERLPHGPDRVYGLFRCVLVRAGGPYVRAHGATVAEAAARAIVQAGEQQES